MYLFKYSIQNTFSKYFQHTFYMLLQATMLKPACIVGAVNFSGLHSRVAFVKGCGTNEESDWFNNFIFNFNSRNWWIFSFSVSGNEAAESDTSSVSLKCLQYLEDKSTALDCLHKFPTIRNMFIMYNSDIPTSAPCNAFFLCGYGFDKKAWVHDRWHIWTAITV